MTDLGTTAERQAQIRSIVVEHDGYRAAFDSLAQFHRPVNGGLHSVGSLSVLLGDSRTGKTFATKRYAKQFPETIGEAGLITPVLYVDMPMEGSGGPRAILESLAAALHLPITLRMNNPMIITAILRAIVDRGVEHLLLDEWDQVFRENDRRLTGFGRGLLRKILNLGTSSVTCIGLHPTYDLMKVDEQLTGRGGLPYRVLRPYSWESIDERQSFRVLCDAFDRQMPFAEQAGLGKLGLAERLFWVTQGNIGRLKVMLEAAAALAINDEAPRIEMEHFADAYEQRKPPGTAFNPFLHDMSQAPKQRSRDGGAKSSSKVGSVSQMFSKQPPRNIVDEIGAAV